MILFQVGSLRGYYHFKHVGKSLRHKRHIHEKTKLLLSEEEVRLLRFHHAELSYTLDNPKSLPHCYPLRFLSLSQRGREVSAPNLKFAGCGINSSSDHLAGAVHQ